MACPLYTSMAAPSTDAYTNMWLMLKLVLIVMMLLLRRLATFTRR